MTSNGKQLIVTRKMLTAVARDRRLSNVAVGISTRFSNFAFVLFCYETNNLMTGPLGNNEFCFPSSRETLRFSGNKTHFSDPLGTSHQLSVNYTVLYKYGKRRRIFWLGV